MKKDALDPAVLARTRKLRHSPSYAEKVLWAQSRNNKIGFKFRRQHPIGEYVLDFYCFEAKLVR